MSKDDQELAQQLARNLRAMIDRRIPQAVNAGSVQLVRDFKDWHAKSMKAVNSGRLSTQLLQSQINQGEKFFR